MKWEQCDLVPKDTVRMNGDYDIKKVWRMK